MPDRMIPQEKLDYKTLFYLPATFLFTVICHKNDPLILATVSGFNFICSITFSNIPAAFNELFAAIGLEPDGVVVASET